MTDLSIAIVAYKNEADVGQAVASIVRHTDPKLKKKIYIVDNGQSPGGLSSLAEKYEEVIYFKMPENLGFGRGHNYVLPMLDSKYHAIVNPDILLKEDSFGVLTDFLERTKAGMAVPRLLGTDGQLQAVYRREVTVLDMGVRMFLPFCFRKRQAYHTMQDMDYDKPFLVPFAQGSFLVVKTELFVRLGGFDPRYFMYMEDVDLCRRVNACSSLYYCPDTEVIHRWERGSKKDVGLLLQHLKSMLCYFRKWGWKLW